MKRVLILVSAFLMPASAALADRLPSVPTSWQLVNVGRDLRTLELTWDPGSCDNPNAHAHVTETAHSIRIAVARNPMETNVPLECYVDPFDSPNYLRVHLHRRVAGRRIVGGPRLSDSVDYLPKTGDFVGVPRVIDLAYKDARQVLRAQGFKVRRFGRKAGVVSFQSPPPGTRARRSFHTVRLTLGRHNFHARKLRRCMSSSDLHVIAARPGVGDEDSPDLALFLGGSALPVGAVALYADPARAHDNAPVIRSEARKANAVVERHGRVTILWIVRPTAVIRDRVRSCVAGVRP